MSNERLTDFIAEVEQLNRDSDELRIALGVPAVGDTLDATLGEVLRAHVTFTDAD